MGMLLVAILSMILFACNGDEPGIKGESGNVSKATLAQIKETFPGMRLDSIHFSWGGYIKLQYKGDLLTLYRECDENGKTHDAEWFEFEYTPDTIYINRNKAYPYKAVIGSNGLVAELLCPHATVSVNTFTYNEQNQIIRLESCLDNDACKDYYEVSWNGDNVTSVLDYYHYDGEATTGPFHCGVYKYSYTSMVNPGRILPWGDNWLTTKGATRADDIYYALYYAGLLGRGTSNLYSSYSHKWENGEIYNSPVVSYTMDEEIDNVLYAYKKDRYGEYSREYFFSEK